MHVLVKVAKNIIDGGPVHGKSFPNEYSIPPPIFPLPIQTYSYSRFSALSFNYIIKKYSSQQDGRRNMPTSSYIRMFLMYQCFRMSFIHVHSMGFTRPHSRQVAHVYYQLFDSKMANDDQLCSKKKKSLWFQRIPLPKYP